MSVVGTSSRSLKGVVREIVPLRLRKVLWSAESWVAKRRAEARLARLRRQVSACAPGSRLRYLGYTVTINDGVNFYMVYKDIVIRRIYHFEAERPDPLILDCGSNIGLSILYFKHVYPRARIIGFEPDPTSHPSRAENIRRSGLNDVQLVQAAVAGRAGTLTFHSDGKYGSCLGEHVPENAGRDWTRHKVPCVLLRDYLAEPVAFLKMNVEGAEWDTLAACEDRLQRVREMVIEYHHLPGRPRTLHKILGLLYRQGFEYLINDFDPETNPAACPPFRLGPDSRYHLLIYGKRRECGSGEEL